jgi:superfamily II DNA/RNA helicase
MSTFKELGLAPWLLSSLKSLQILTPTPIQTTCVPPALQGQDIIGCAETGSGKTLAFGLPILHKLSQGEGANNKK